MLGDLHAQIACVRTGERRLGAIIDRFGIADRRPPRATRSSRRPSGSSARPSRRSRTASTRAEGCLDDDGIRLGEPVLGARPRRDRRRPHDRRPDASPTTPRRARQLRRGAGDLAPAASPTSCSSTPTRRPNGGSFRAARRCACAAAPCSPPSRPRRAVVLHAARPADRPRRQGARAACCPTGPPAASYGDSMIIMRRRRRPPHRRPASSTSSRRRAAGAAGTAGDGENGADQQRQRLGIKDLPIEVLETRYPMRMTAVRLPRRLGRRRAGGAAATASSASTRSTARRRTCRSGSSARGRPPGASSAARTATPPDVVVNPGRDGRAPRCSRQRGCALGRGDVIRGPDGRRRGLRRPGERDPAAVARDLRDGVVTPAAARAAYGDRAG